MELDALTGFDWDAGNESKNWIRHQVTKTEAEEVFFNEPLLIQEDEAHSTQEARFAAWGFTNEQRKLVVIFTQRKDKIRVISARDMKRKEREAYEAHS